MQLFRTKMAATLLSTVFNERLDKPFIPSHGDENMGSESDCQIVDPREIQQSREKRKPMICLESSFKTMKINTNTDHEEQNVLEYYKDWPLNTDDLIEIFCDYILSIDDPAQLE
jgi:hypothetical protein